MADTPLALYTKIKARLITDARYAVYDGAVTSVSRVDLPGVGPVPDAYVVLYPDPGTALRDRLVAAHSNARWDVRAVCVGRTTSQCMNTTELVRDLLTGWRLDPDRAVSPLNEQDNQAVLIKDESDLQDIRWSFTLHYRIHTVRS